MRASRLMGALTAAAAMVLPGAAPAGAAESTIEVTSVTVSTSTISLTGALNYGDDALSTVTLGTDSAGDALTKGIGLDITGVTVRPDLAAKRLFWTLSVSDGMADPVGGNAPATGLMIPIVVDGQDWWRWLAAGTAGTNITNLGKSTWLCSNETASGTQGGWSCPTGLTGSITSTGVTWTQPFSQMKPQMTYGSLIESGSIFGGTPRSFAWPSVFVLAGTAPSDVMDWMDSYRIPGGVELGIAPAATPPGSVNFSATGTFNANAKTFSGALAKPTTAGSYNVWARSCFGLAETPTCILSSSPVTI